MNLCFVPEIPNMILLLAMCDRAQQKISPESFEVIELHDPETPHCS
jgi:hypothetical protein